MKMERAKTIGRVKRILAIEKVMVAVAMWMERIEDMGNSGRYCKVRRSWKR